MVSLGKIWFVFLVFKHVEVIDPDELHKILTAFKGSFCVVQPHPSFGSFPPKSLHFYTSKKIAIYLYKLGVNIQQ